MKTFIQHTNFRFQNAFYPFFLSIEIIYIINKCDLDKSVVLLKISDEWMPWWMNQLLLWMEWVLSIQRMFKNVYECRLGSNRHHFDDHTKIFNKMPVFSVSVLLSRLRSRSIFSRVNNIFDDRLKVTNANFDLHIPRIPHCCIIYLNVKQNKNVYFSEIFQMYHFIHAW